MQIYFQKIPKQRKGGDGLRTNFFENPGGSFHIFTLSLEISEKAQLSPWIFHKIVLDPLEIPRPKIKTPGNRTLFFLGYSWKFHSFLLNPRKFHMLFLWYPWKYHILTLLVCIFSEIAQHCALVSLFFLSLVPALWHFLRHIAHTVFRPVWK